MMAAATAVSYYSSQRLAFGTMQKVMLRGELQASEAVTLAISDHSFSTRKELGQGLVI